jgi:hypothetical protein
MQLPASYSTVLQTLSYSKHTLVFIVDYNVIMNIFYSVYSLTDRQIFESSFSYYTK